MIWTYRFCWVADYLILFWVLQSVEETECRRAYESAVDVYNSSFDHKKTAEEVVLLISNMHFALSFF